MQECGPTMALGYSCTNFATTLVEAQCCSALVAKAEERWALGQE